MDADVHVQFLAGALNGIHLARVSTFVFSETCCISSFLMRLPSNSSSEAQSNIAQTLILCRLGCSVKMLFLKGLEKQRDCHLILR